MILVVLIMWVLGWVLLCRMTPCTHSPDASSLPSVSVIIPARNEEQNLPELLDSLQAQSFPPLEILVVDDESTDQTAEIARRNGAQVVPSAPLPAGWRGKPWACHQGAAITKGDLLCFADADTRFAPNGLQRAAAEWTRTKGALSLAAWHDVRTWTEQLSAFFNLMMSVGIGAFTIAGDRVRPRGLFGPFLLVSRQAYDAVGGHTAVKDRILENVNMAACFQQAGIPMACRCGHGVLSIRMYPHGVRELAAGWGKAFAAGAANTPAWLMLPAVGWLSGAIIACLALLLSPVHAIASAPLWGGMYLLFVLQFAFMLHRLGRFKWTTSLLYPFPLAFYLIVFMNSARTMKRGTQVTWKGRQIDTDSAGKGTSHAH